MPRPSFLRAGARLGLLLAAPSCTIGWDPHPPAPTFELVGLHEPLACVACHPADQPLGPLPTACASCHEAARPPSHYDGDCGLCHTPYGWDDIVVDHDFFPLEDAHDLACDACHVSGFAGLDPSCASCHEPDRLDGHLVGRDCGECHVPTAWKDATYDHDFRVPHEGVNACLSCHPGYPASFGSTCTTCHEHSRSRTDGEHDEVGNYQYDDAACLRCHPNGEGD